MSTQTTNYGLVKPQLTDTPNITAMNTNWDIIDEKLKEAMESGGSVVEGDYLPLTGGTVTGETTFNTDVKLNGGATINTTLDFKDSYAPSNSNGTLYYADGEFRIQDANYDVPVWIGEPTKDSHAATKKYVDDTILIANGTEVFYIEITKTGSTTYTADKTFAEIQTAYEAGKNVVCRFNLLGDIEIYKLRQFVPNIEASFNHIMISSTNAGKYIRSIGVRITSENICERTVEDVSPLPATGGTLSGNLTITNGNALQSGEPYLTWKTVNANTPYVGFAQDQTDGTFILCSLKGTDYRSGLAIGGGSGNLLWKGTKVATISDVPTETRINALIDAKVGVIENGAY